MGNERIAHLTRNVRLTDRKGTLLTEDLEYDLKTGIGKYNNGGKVVNGTTTLTSTNGIYYSDTKDVLFKNKVHLRDPKYKIDADSLLYNTQTEIATFIGPTHIKNKDFDANTTSGYYNMKTGEALFDQRSIFKDSTGTTFTADRIASEETTGTVQMEGTAIIRDSANGYTVIAGQIFMNKKQSSFLANRKPVLIIHRDKDSTYIAADTLFSSIGKGLRNAKTEITIDSLRKDSASKTTVKDSITLKKDTLSTKKDTAIAKRDTLKIIKDTTTTKRDSVISRKDTISIKDKYDTLKSTKSLNLNKDSIRYFLAFHHVRVFNDSIQSVSDSLYYSAEDSVFRLYQKPVVWSGKTQITGDTMYLFTKNKKAERLYVFENAIVVNQSKGNFYNQMGGKTLNGYFVDGAMDYIRVKGSPAESVYYAQDKDSAYIGMNRVSGEAIDLFFKKSELTKVKFVNDVKGTLHPIRKIPEGQSQLKNFNWQDKRRPKNKLELFE